MLISPILALVQGLRSKDQRYQRWVLTLFATIYASTFSLKGIGDGTRHWQRVYDYYTDLSFSQFWSDLIGIILFRTNAFVNDDVYIHLLSYFVGGVLGAPGLFFVFVGFVYGYFFAGSMVKIFRCFPSFFQHFPYFIIAVYFIAILNLQSMNTVRTWTGFWVMFYGVLQYHETRRLKYFALIFAAPLIHIGYFIMALPIWAVVFLPLKRYWIMIVYVASFSFTFITPQFVMSSLQSLELEAGRAKAQDYYTETKETVAGRIEKFGGSRWYRVYKKSGILDWAVVGIVLVFLINGDYLRRMDSLESLLFSAGLASKVLSNSIWFIWAASNRSATIANLFVLAAITVYWQRNYLAGKAIDLYVLLKPVLYTAILFIITGFFFYLSNTLEYLSAYIFFLPELAWTNEDIKITIRELLGILLGID